MTGGQAPGGFREGSGSDLVLVVDDSRADLRLIEECLKPLGLTLRQSTDAFEAIASLYESEFAVALIDVRMPGLDGFELAAEIRRHPRAGGLPILFVTGDDLSEEEMRCAYAMHVVDVIAKPFAPEVLRAKVSVFVELERRRRAGESRRSLEELLVAIAGCAGAPLQRLDRLLRGAATSPAPIDTLRGESARARRLVGRIEEVARLCLDAGPAEDLSLAAPIALALDRMGRALDAAGGAIDIDVAPRVRARLPQLETLFRELFDNALRFRGPEPLRIRVRAERIGDEVLVRVEDNGVGVEPDESQRIFALFPPHGGVARFDPARDGDRGIGLALVRRLVAMGGGEIWCETDAPGPGACVAFTLPKADPQSR